MQTRLLIDLWCISTVNMLAALAGRLLLNSVSHMTGAASSNGEDTSSS
jgi:hypothetical protein